jgi:hypothetical protein
MTSWAFLLRQEQQYQPKPYTSNNTKKFEITASNSNADLIWFLLTKKSPSTARLVFYRAEEQGTPSPFCSINIQN